MKTIISGLVFGLIVAWWYPLFTGGDLTAEQFRARAFVMRRVALPPATCTPSSGNTSSLNTCITNAARGDTISVPVANYTTATSINFPTKTGSFTGSNYITIQSAKVASLPNRRVGPSDAPNMPTLTTTGNGVVLLSLDSGDSGWKFDGLQLTNNISNPKSGADYTPNMVKIGAGAANNFFDRMLVHPKEHPTAATKYLTTGQYGFGVGGVGANDNTIQRSYIYDFYGRDPDAAKYAGMSTEQAISNISNANPAVITCTAACGVSKGDVVQIINAGGGMVGLFQTKSSGTTGDDKVVTSIDSTHFSVPVDTSAVAAYDAAANASFFRWPKIVSITNANPAVVTVSNYTPVTGEIFRPRGLASTLGSTLNGNDYTITAINSTSFSIAVNTTSLSVYSGSGGYFKSQGTGQQTIAIGVDANVHGLNVLNNYLQAWYATMQTAGSDGTRQSPTMTTIKSSPTPTITRFQLNSTTGLSVGMPIAVLLTNDHDTSGPNGGSAHCPNHNIGIECWGVGIVSALDTRTGAVTLDPQLMSKNENGTRVPAYMAPAGGTEAAWGGTMTQNINYNYNTLEIPDDFSEFHYATNGNTGKGVIEGKACYNCVFNGNIIQGFPSSFSLTTTNQNCSSPWIQTSLITISNNWFKKYRTGVLLSLVDYSCVCTQGHDITVTNNLFGEGVTTGDFIRIGGAASNVTITHNTVIRKAPNGATTELNAGGTASGGCPACSGSTQYYPTKFPPGVVIRDNIFPAAYYLAICYKTADGGTGSAFLTCFSSPTQDHNSFYYNIAGSDPRNPTTIFPGATNATFTNLAAVPFVGSNYDVLANWAVQASSTAHNSASDRTDRGVNITLLRAALLNNDGFNTTANSQRP